GTCRKQTSYKYCFFPLGTKAHCSRTGSISLLTRNPVQLFNLASPNIDHAYEAVFTHLGIVGSAVKSQPSIICLKGLAVVQKMALKSLGQLLLLCVWVGG